VCTSLHKACAHPRSGVSRGSAQLLTGLLIGRGAFDGGRYVQLITEAGPIKPKLMGTNKGNVPVTRAGGLILVRAGHTKLTVVKCEIGDANNSKTARGNKA
jgi:hypothetical protein